MSQFKENSAKCQFHLNWWYNQTSYKKNKKILTKHLCVYLSSSECDILQTLAGGESITAISTWKIHLQRDFLHEL